MAQYSDIAVTGKDNVKDADSLRQALTSLLQTQKGERIFLPNYGSDIEQFLYQPIDDWTADDIKASIKDNVLSDSRMNLQTLEVTADPDNNLYRVNIAVLFEGVGVIEETMELKSKIV